MPEVEIPLSIFRDIAPNDGVQTCFKCKTFWTGLSGCPSCNDVGVTALTPAMLPDCDGQDILSRLGYKQLGKRYVASNVKWVVITDNTD